MKAAGRMLAVAVTTVALLHTTISQSAPVKEPSATPATLSRLAAQRPLIAVAMAGARIVAVGQMGHIVYSDDGGKHWTQAAVPVSVDLVAVRFQSETRGWVCGHDGILLRTDDGAVSWHVVLEGRELAKMMQTYYTPLAAGDEARYKAALDESLRFVQEQGARPLLDIWFDDARIGYVIGAWGLILRTDDGGKSWLPWLEHVDNPRSNHLNAIARVDQQLWIVGEQGLLLRYDDKLQRFAAIKSPAPGSLFGITGDDTAVIVYGLAGRAYTSSDGGNSWVAAKLEGGAGLTGGVRLRDGRVVLVDSGAGIWISKDAGLSFKTVLPQRAMPFFAVAASAAESIALVGTQGVQVQTLPQ